MDEAVIDLATCHGLAANTDGVAQGLIVVKGLTLRGGARTLVQALDWRAAAGECWAVLGANGAGKSSLLAALAGVLSPAAGSVTWHGLPALAGAGRSPKPVVAARALARLRAYLPQQVSDAFGASVLDTVLLGRYAHGSGLGWEDADDVARAEAALVSVGMAACGPRDVRSLSGGERQRVALAMLLVQDTPLLLLDEPLSHQDPGQQVNIGNLLAAHVAKGASAEAAPAALAAAAAAAVSAPVRAAGAALTGAGSRAVVMALHDVNHALRFATHALVLLPDGASLQGRASALLTPAVLELAYGHPFRAVRDGEFTWMRPA